MATSPSGFRSVEVTLMLDAKGIGLIDDRSDPLVIELSIGTDDASACTITPYGDVMGITRLSPQESTPRHSRYTSLLVFRRPVERPRD